MDAFEVGMSETDFQVRVLEILVNAYVELNKISAAPGDRAHMLAYSIKFIERQIKEYLK